MDIKFKLQKHFPYLEIFRKKLPINDQTIFVYIDTIYSNMNKKDWDKYYDILFHEIRHLHQGNEIGFEKWILNYLQDDNFRLKMELDAYLYQLRKVKEIGDNEELMNITTECITNISSPLYGNMISYKDAEKYFKDNLK